MSTFSEALERPIACPSVRLTPAGVVRSEWTKLISLRSTRLALVAAIVMLVSFGAIACSAAVKDWASMSAQAKATFDPVLTILRGVDGAELAVGVLGVLAITAEYGTGTIRSTLATVPRRLPVLWAKILVLAALTFASCAPTALLAFAVGQWILHGKQIAISLDDPGVARAVIGAAIYLTLLGVFSLGLGAVLRSTAAGISVLVSIIFVIPALVQALGATWRDAVIPYLPTSAGQAILSVRPDPHSLSPWTGLAVFCAYTAGLVMTAAFMLRARDV